VEMQRGPGAAQREAEARRGGGSALALAEAAPHFGGGGQCGVRQRRNASGGAVQAEENGSSVAGQCIHFHCT
jgi:hypothetical protein